MSSLVVRSPVSIPDFQTIMLPLLEFARDDREHPLSEAIEYLVIHFNLTDAERKELRRNLAQELLERIKSCSPAFFERLVIELLVKMGYGGSLADAGKAIGRTGDEGIDGIIKEDRLGLDVIYIQAKRWQNTIGRPDIQQFVGALAGKGAKKGVFITTSKFSEQAKSYLPADIKVVLIDGEQLANYAIDVNLGVSVICEYQIKRLDLDYFEGE